MVYGLAYPHISYLFVLIQVESYFASWNFTFLYISMVWESSTFNFPFDLPSSFPIVSHSPSVFRLLMHGWLSVDTRSTNAGVRA